MNVHAKGVVRELNSSFQGFAQCHLQGYAAIRGDRQVREPVLVYFRDESAAAS